MYIYCYRSTCKDFDMEKTYPKRGVFSIQRYDKPVPCELDEAESVYGEVWFDRPLFPDETYSLQP